jgi:uncharacterized protein (UPF0276 family)
MPGPWLREQNELLLSPAEIQTRSEIDSRALLRPRRCTAADLLPLPYTRETLASVVRHIDEVQHTLGVRMLLENPSTMFNSDPPIWTRSNSCAALPSARDAGCCSMSTTSMFRPSTTASIPRLTSIRFRSKLSAKIHLAGFAEDHDTNAERFLIDAHGSPVADAVWALYWRTLARSGPVPTLIERDNDVPDYGTVVAEVALARAALSDEARRRNRCSAA